MRFYNTLTKKVEEFVPHNEDEVKMYTCGPTVYHYAHIGNLRTYIFEDILEKSLEYIGYNVKRVMNITDVGHMTSDSDTGEDKMLKGAARENKTVWEIADYYTNAFFNDAEQLNIRKPLIIEKASDLIEDYIKMIEKLLDDGYAYISNNNVYFDISKNEDYYKLSGKNSDDLLIGARDDVEEDEFKKNPYDFGLWFTVSKFENQAMQWDSPWGRGYPGWHIECSGIAIKHLGEHLDIHCGGVDNIFPHHTNEIAQSEAFLGHKWCKYWLHGEHLNEETGKMSKSKGEFLTVSLLEEKGYNPLAYRYFCLQSHYRNQLVFSYPSLDTAVSGYKRLLSRVNQIKNNLSGDIDFDQVSKYQESFKDGLKNDLNTSTSLTILYDVLKDEALNNNTKLYLIADFDSVLSLDLLKEKEIELSLELLSYIENTINMRNEAKINKNYELADKLRDELKEKGIIIEDGREGTTYEIVR
ncbi:MAG: cysteine--tRNA ligase [Bacilli bacterium]|nr:cysteine--tRNA ligase [Bacilli bacterium]MDD4283077.1 cysteine--tRNA ligase [Bacilli bacterium]MDD4718892.1 cysteine--tRNA ligase [Bacilli bacterium]